MSLDTYANLKTEIADKLARSDITADSSIIDTGIDLFEAAAKRDLRAEEYILSATLSTVANTESVDLPSGFKQVSSLSLATDPRTLQLVTREELRRRFDVAQYGRPSVYAPGPYNTATSRQTVLLGAIPDSVYSLALLYSAELTALSDTNTTNWLLSYAPDLYFYGTLRHILIYLGENDTDSRAAIDAAYLEVKASVGLDQSRKRSGGDSQPRKAGMTP